MLIRPGFVQSGSNMAPLKTMKRTMAAFALALALALAAGLPLAGIGQAQQKQLSIATGGTGGVYYPLGGGWRACCRRTCPACRPPPRSPAARSTTSS